MAGADILSVLSLGAGVQSTTLALMGCEGKLRMDAAIFADTGWEPSAVYAHLDWLESQMLAAGIPLYRVSNGNIRQDAVGAGRRFVGLPLYLQHPDGHRGRGRRQCTSEYKITPIRRKLREMGASFRHPVKMLIGISLDEVTRMRDSQVKYVHNAYPLVDQRMTRSDCLHWLKTRGYPKPQKSACIGCPFRRNAEWRSLRPSEFADAVAFDRAIRHQTSTGGSTRLPQFLHDSLVPLDMVDFSTEQDHGQMELDFDGCGVICAGDEPG